MHTLQSLIDGSNDAGNIDNELLLVVWFDKEMVGEKVYTRVSYFNVARPASVCAEGLFQVLRDSLESLGINVDSQEQCAKLVGVGIDSASANVAAAGLKGYVEGIAPWIFWM